jgi:hypothetical protein
MQFFTLASKNNYFAYQPTAYISNFDRRIPAKSMRLHSAIKHQRKQEIYSKKYSMILVIIHLQHLFINAADISKSIILKKNLLRKANDKNECYSFSRLLF